MRLGLGRKLLLGMVVVLLPMLALLLWEFRREVRWLETSRIEAQLATAEAVGIAVERQLDTAVGVGWAVALDPRVRTCDREVLDPYLNELARVYPFVTSVAVFDARGANCGYGHATLTPPEPRLAVGDRAYFREVLATNLPAVSNVVELRVAHAPGVVVGVPIRDANGRAIGLVSVAMDANQLARQYRQLNLFPAQSFFLVDRDGRLAFHSARPSLAPEDAASMRDLPELVAALSGVPSSSRSFVSPLLGDERIGAFVRTARYNWVVGSTMPRRVALLPAYQRLRGQMFAFAAVAALTSALAATIARVLLRPVFALEAAARALGSGDLARRVEIRTGDELERLGDSFNEMAARLEARNRALEASEAHVRALNAELEARVRERTEELEAANRELEAFGYSVSHDLRAPLRAVDGFVTATLDDFGSALPEGAVAYMERARAGARRMRDLIDGLLALSRASRTTLTRVQVDMTALAREVADELVAGVQNPVEVRVGVLPPCSGDPVLLRQVLSNLIGNALKYTREQPQPRVEIDYDPGPPGAWFVRDNGVGLDMAHAEKLFQPFQRMAQPKGFEGSGIGLAIVHRIVARHGGRVWAESEPGKGATFRFTLGE